MRNCSRCSAAASGTYGSLTIDASGNWTYTLDNANAAVQALPLGATMNDTVTVTAIDGTTHDITITITGTNDAAVIAGVDTGDVTEDGGALQVTSGTLTISDIDTGEELFKPGTYGPAIVEHNGDLPALRQPLDNVVSVQQWRRCAHRPRHRWRPCWSCHLSRLVCPSG